MEEAAIIGNSKVTSTMLRLHAIDAIIGRNSESVKSLDNLSSNGDKMGRFAKFLIWNDSHNTPGGLVWKNIEG